MSLVCPRCVVYRATKFCGDCGGQCYNENQCTQCSSVTPNCLFCPNCGAPLYKQLLKGGGGGSVGGGHYKQHSGGYQQPKVHPRDIIGGKTTEAPVFFQETVRPSEVFKGVSANEEEALSRYRTQFTEGQKDDDEFTNEFLAKYPVSRVGTQPNQKPVYSSSSAQYSSGPKYKPPPASQALRGNQSQHYGGGGGGGVWGAKYGGGGGGGSSYQQQTQVNPEFISKESTIRPSLAKQTGDDLDKYRLKWEVQLKDLPVNSDKPVVVSVSGNLVVSTYGSGGKVNEEVTTGPSGDAVFEINVPAISAVPFRKELKFEQGRFVRFSVSDGTLSFKQTSD